MPAEVTRKKEEAPPAARVSQLQATLEDLTAKHVSGALSKEDYMRQYQAVDDEIGGVRCGSIMELKEAMRATGLYDAEQLDRWVAHENSHAALAQQMGKPIYFRLIFTRDVSGNVMTSGVTPSVRIDFHETTPEEYKRTLREVTEAPDELSEGDEAALRALDAQA